MEDTRIAGALMKSGRASPGRAPGTAICAVLSVSVKSVEIAGMSMLSVPIGSTDIIALGIVAGSHTFVRIRLALMHGLTAGCPQNGFLT